MRLGRRLGPYAASVAGAFLLAAIGVPAQLVEEPASAGERVDVTAVSVLVRVVGPPEAVASFDASDIVVREDGAARGVLSLLPLARSARQPTVGTEEATGATEGAGAGSPAQPVISLYVDAETLGRSALEPLLGAFESHLGELVQVGKVELVIAGAPPSVVVPATTDAASLGRALERAAKDAGAYGGVERIRRSLVRGGPSISNAVGLRGTAEEEARFVRDRKARFLDWVARNARLRRPRLVFLFAGGYDQDLTPFYLDRVPRDEDRPRMAADLRELHHGRDDQAIGEILASIGWLLFPVSPGDIGWGSFGGADQGREESHRRWQRFMGSGPSSGGRPDLLFDDPLAGWRAIADPTGGEVLTGAPSIDEELMQLGELRLLSYSRPGTPSGRVFELSLESGRAGVSVLGPSRAAESSPEELAALRVIVLFEERSVNDGIGVLLERLEDPARAADSTVRLRVTLDLSAVEQLSSGPRELRVSSAVSGESGSPLVRHQLLRLGPGEAMSAFEIALRLKPENQQLALSVEDLATGLSGGQALDLRPNRGGHR